MAAKPIVAGTDGSEESLRAVDWAAREAALRGAPLRIVAAAEAPRPAGGRLGPACRAEPRARSRGYRSLGLDERFPGRRPRPGASWDLGPGPGG